MGSIHDSIRNAQSEHAPAFQAINEISVLQRTGQFTSFNTRIDRCSTPTMEGSINSQST